MSLSFSVTLVQCHSIRETINNINTNQATFRQGGKNNASKMQNEYPANIQRPEIANEDVEALLRSNDIEKGDEMEWDDVARAREDAELVSRRVGIDVEENEARQALAFRNKVESAQTAVADPMNGVPAWFVPALNNVLK